MTKEEIKNKLIETAQELKEKGSTKTHYYITIVAILKKEYGVDFK